MTFDASLYALLTANAGLTAAVATRIYPGIGAQDGAKPYVVFSVEDVTPQRDLAGNFMGLTRARVTVASFSTSDTDAKATADLVTAALDGFRGLMAGAGSKTLLQCESTGQTNATGEDDEDAGLFRFSESFSVMYR